MNPVLGAAVSGMVAATRRLGAAAHNVANVSSDGPLPDAPAAAAFPAAATPWQVDQVETAGGTRADIVTSSPAAVAVADPDAPYADADGMVAAPNVDLTGEAVDMLVARYAFAANAAVVRAADRTSKSLLDILV